MKLILVLEIISLNWGSSMLFWSLNYRSFCRVATNMSKGKGTARWIVASEYFSQTAHRSPKTNRRVQTALYPRVTSQWLPAISTGVAVTVGRSLWAHDVVNDLTFPYKVLDGSENLFVFKHETSSSCDAVCSCFTFKFICGIPALDVSSIGHNHRHDLGAWRLLFLHFF